MILRKNVSLLIILSVTILGTQIAVVNTKSVWILVNKEQLVSNVNFAYQVRRWACTSWNGYCIRSVTLLKEQNRNSAQGRQFEQTFPLSVPSN